MAENQKKIFAPGARILVRDAEWMIRRVERTSTNGLALHSVGLAERVCDKEAIFLIEIDKTLALCKNEWLR